MKDSMLRILLAWDPVMQLWTLFGPPSSKPPSVGSRPLLDTSCGAILEDRWHQSGQASRALSPASKILVLILSS